MDTRWFKEDRALPKGEQKEAIKASEEALKNSTFMSRRLKDICKCEVDATYRVEEDFDKPGYLRKIIAAAARRKALNEIIKILP